MDFCDICLDPPRPLEGRITGAVRLDAVEGNRRLLAELPPVSYTHLTLPTKHPV